MTTLPSLQFPPLLSVAIRTASGDTYVLRADNRVAAIDAAYEHFCAGILTPLDLEAIGDLLQAPIEPPRIRWRWRWHSWFWIPPVVLFVLVSVWRESR